MAKTEKVYTISDKYPTFRDEPIINAKRWLDGRREDDNAEGLWRVHDKLYDLTDFVQKHPGGADWLAMTEGADITDFFETHHLTKLPAQTLAQFYVKEAREPRNYKFTYHEDGFYKTIKRRVVEKLPTLDKRPTQMLKTLTDCYLAFTFGFAIYAIKLNSYYLASVAAFFLAWTTLASHNYVHQKFNFRRFYMNFSVMNFRSWIIIHNLSHHMHPNTFHDLQTTIYEPYFQWIPAPKTKVQCFFSIVVAPFIYATIFTRSFVHKAIASLKSTQQLFFLDDLLSFALPTAMFIFGKSDVVEVFWMWMYLLLMGSFVFGLTNLNTGHHHPEVPHQGDELHGSMDFGIFQLDTVIERSDIKKSKFIGLTNFGDHSIHHLFPTLDHGYLSQLYDVFSDVCKEFKIKEREEPWRNLILGQFQQLTKQKPMSLAEWTKNR